MGTRGRKSSAELETRPQIPLTVTARPDACYSLRGEEAEVWQGIVESLPADWITPGSAPVLAAYCRAAVSARRIGQIVVQIEASDDYEVDEHLKLIRAHSQVASTLKALAASLRLTPQSRYTPQRAGQVRPEGARPWER